VSETCARRHHLPAVAPRIRPKLRPRIRRYACLLIGWVQRGRRRRRRRRRKVYSKLTQ